MTREKSAAQQFADLQRLKVQEAADYLKGRGKLTQTYSWQDLWHEEHGQQFTVSRLARLDLLKAMQDGITASVDGDLSRRDWMRDIKGLLKKEGWWGEISVLDPKTGETVVTKFDNARLKLIFDTNTRMAYSAGDWERTWRNRATHPYIRYITKGDERVRATHRQWNNLVLPVDHPFWEAHWPPNAWRCRCRVVSLTQAEYDKGYSETRDPYEYNPDGTVKRIPEVRRVPFNKVAPEERFVEWTNKRTGEVSQVPAGIAPGFDYNPGLARTRQEGLAKVAREKLAAAPVGLAKAAAKDFTPVETPAQVAARENAFRKLVTYYDDWVKDVRGELTRRGESDRGLSDAELVALHLYTHDRTMVNYQQINRALRGWGSTAKDDLKMLKPAIKTLNVALAKLPAYTGTVRRGTFWVPDAEIAKYQAGKTVKFSEFLSTGKEKGFKGGFQYEIESKSGRDVSFIALNQGEGEVLMPSGLNFHVVGVEKKGDVLTVRLKEK